MESYKSVLKKGSVIVTSWRTWIRLCFEPYFLRSTSSRTVLFLDKNNFIVLNMVFCGNYGYHGKCFEGCAHFVCIYDYDICIRIHVFAHNCVLVHTRKEYLLWSFWIAFRCNNAFLLTYSHTEKLVWCQNKAFCPPDVLLFFLL